jgi:hypothetical protein
MRTSEHKVERCDCCGHSQYVGLELFACDECAASLVGEGLLRMDVYNNGPEGSTSSERQFCSWRCLLAHLPKIQSDYFASMPFLHFDEAPAGQSAADFLAAIAGQQPPEKPEPKR